MSKAATSDESQATYTDEYYEKLASQEQVYLDEVEARLIEALVSALPVLDSENIPEASRHTGSFGCTCDLCVENSGSVAVPHESTHG